MQLPAVPVSALAVLAAYCASGALATGGGGVVVRTLEKKGAEAEGTAAVAANGTLTPFGEVGLGCGINWKDETNYGGGLQAGSSTLGLGLGGGWSIGPGNMTAGLGIGLPDNVRANVSVAIDYKAGVEFTLTSSAPMQCFPSEDRDGGNYYVVCSSVKSA